MLDCGLDSSNESITCLMRTRLELAGRSMIAQSVFACSCVVASSSALSQVSVASLPRVPGADEMRASGLSADGFTVVGTTRINGQSRGFRWTNETGTIKISPPSEDEHLIVRAVSGDGAVLVGSINSPRLGTQAFRWTERDGVLVLPTLLGMSGGEAFAVSLDGTTIVGLAFAFAGGARRGFRWTESDGTTSLGEPPAGFEWTTASGVSADGRVVCGTAFNALQSRAFRWSSQGGFQLLDSRSDWLGTTATSVNADGSLIAGFATAGTYDPIALRWAIGGAYRVLGTELTGSRPFAGACISGSVVSGSSTLERGSGGSLATVWNVDESPVAVNRYLFALGIDSEVDVVGPELVATALAGTILVGTSDYAVAYIQLPTAPHRCAADVAQSTDISGLDFGVTIEDLVVYLESWYNGALWCDLDDGTETGTRDAYVTIEDLVYYLQLYSNGC